MTLVKFNPFAPVTANRVNHFDKWVNDFFNDESNVKFRTAPPSVNIIENGDSFKLEIAVPGLAKEDFKVHVEANVLTISAEKKTEKTTESEETQEKYLHREFSYSSFKRSFTLPDNVNANAVKGSYENGVLNIEIPKAEVKKITQTIEIQ